MADSNISVSGPVAIRSNSKESVAFDLMVKIGYAEAKNDSSQSSREYWLTLYRQCYKAADNSSLATILEKD